MPKTISPALQSYLQSFASAADQTLCVCDLYTITLSAGNAAGIADGQVIAVTDFHDPVPWNGLTYVANSILVSGLKYKAECGVNVDSQQITIAARASDLIGGAPFLQAIGNGLLDGAEIQRERAFFGKNFNWPTFAPIGTVILFKGRVAKVDSLGRTEARITVESDLTLLKQEMPRNMFTPSCTWVLYGSGCGLAASSFTRIGFAGAGSTKTFIPRNNPAPELAQGKIVFTSGVNVGVTRTIKASDNSGLTLAYPLPNAPAPGDAYTAYWGCDHTLATCTSRFGNQANFRGFPFVPPPQVITGALATTANQGKG